MLRIIKIIFNEVFKNKTTLFFIFVLAAMSWASFIMEDNVHKGLLTIMNVILFIVPLMSLLFSTVYLHNCREFIILLLGQPIARSTIWQGIYAGVSSSLCAAFLFGAGIPILIYSFNLLGLLMILMGLALTLIFVSLAFLICSYVADKSKGVGIALVIWLIFAIIYDGLTLFIMFQFSDYPIDNLMIGMLMFNPIDLARLQMLIQLDVSAIMGYAGAVFKNFLGVKAGMAVTSVVMILWIVLPYYLSIRRFNKKDM
jgi:Cu-processing system permease protein